MAVDAATTLAADAFADVFGERRGGYNNPRWTQAAPALQPLTICWNADAGRKLLLRVVAVGELMGPAMTRRYHAKKTVRVEIYDASALAIDFGSETANYADGFGIMLKSSPGTRWLTTWKAPWVLRDEQAPAQRHSLLVAAPRTGCGRRTLAANERATVADDGRGIGFSRSCTPGSGNGGVRRVALTVHAQATLIVVGARQRFAGSATDTAAVMVVTVRYSGEEPALAAENPCAGGVSQPAAHHRRLLAGHTFR